MSLAPGTAYHLAATWQDGSQQYYINGVLVHSDTQPGTLGVLGDTSTHPFRLGSDSAGTDVTIDEPTLWVGYAFNIGLGKYTFGQAPSMNADKRGGK
jgi:hypothetical protein